MVLNLCFEFMRNMHHFFLNLELFQLALAWTTFTAHIFTGNVFDKWSLGFITLNQ